MADHFYLGIDLDNENVVISYYELNMKEPETLSMVAGSEVYQIPLLLTKKKGMDQWFIGEEARHLSMEQGEESVSCLLSRTLNQESVFVEGECYPAAELLVLYLKKLFFLAGSLGKNKKPDKVVICLKKLSREIVETFGKIAEGLGLDRGQLMLLDRRECFYYFVYHQPKELLLHDVYLFDYRREDMCCCYVTRQKNTKPQLVTLTEEVRHLDENGRDEAFLRILQACFKGRIVSASYLTGDGFDGGWMKKSVAFLCQGRRAFMGKNLYSKGACYAAAVRENRQNWEYVYLGDSQMKVNVSLKVIRQGKEEFFTLISAGDSWYETIGECEVLLDGTPEIAFWLQTPHSKDARLQKLKLSDLPNRPNRTTRLRVTAEALSDIRVRILIKDLGFGELFKGSQKVWEYVMVCVPEA